MSANPAKILIVRFSSIGDIVLTTPVIRCLKNQLNAEVHFLCKTPYRTILHANPYIDKLYTINSSVNEVLLQLKAENYDAIIDLHKNLRSLQVKLRLKKKVYSFDKINIQKWLIVNLKINKLPHVHIVDRYMDAVSALGVKNDDKGLDYFIPENEDIDIAVFFRKQLPDRPSIKNGEYLALVIGAAHMTKRMPITLLQNICKLVEKPVVLLGGPAEKVEGNLLAKEFSHVVNCCGEFSLNQSAAMVKKAGAVVTSDTGLMHVAAAFKKPVISIWGNTIPEFGMYPYALDNKQDFRLEVKGLSCRPCSKIGYNNCPKGHFNCMKKQALTNVKNALQKLGFVGY